MARSPHGTRADTTYERLRADILAGRLQPGEKLKFPELCERYGVGVGVVREALTRLVQRGLASNQPHVGFQVTPLSRADLIELTDARVQIECLVFRSAIEEGGTRWEADVVATHHTLERTPLYDECDSERISDSWAAAHSAFHHALIAGCPNRRLKEVADTMRDSSEIYHAWSQQTARHPDRDPVPEHRRLMELALARDVESAVDELAVHIQRTTEMLLTSPLSNHPETSSTGLV